MIKLKNKTYAFVVDFLGTAFKMSHSKSFGGRILDSSSVSLGPRMFSELMSGFSVGLCETNLKASNNAQLSSGDDRNDVCKMGS